MIGIVDYGMGNLMSVKNSIEFIGGDVMICKKPEDLDKVERIIIPGVGAISNCIQKLNESGFTSSLNHEVLTNKKPTLGICLGMQVMASISYEGGKYKCLNWFDAEVIRLTPSDIGHKVPSINWHPIDFDPRIPLFKGIPQKSQFYFVHSYFMDLKCSNQLAASYNYPTPITAAIIKDNIFATQFHPEKSQDLGLELLTNFLEWNP